MEPEQVRNIMDSMIRKLYSMELEGQERSNRQDEKLTKELKQAEFDDFQKKLKEKKQEWKNRQEKDA